MPRIQHVQQMILFKMLQWRLRHKKEEVDLKIKGNKWKQSK